MRRTSLILLVLFGLILAWGCKDSSKKVSPPPTKGSECADLDSIFLHIEMLEKELGTVATWPEATLRMDELLPALRKNLDSAGTDCNFLTTSRFPDRDRFYFIELLTETTINQSEIKGILYLIKLRGIFIRDKEVTEFISEDLAHVAYHNPEVYLAYLEAHPQQEEMLLNSTRWVTTDRSALIEQFSGLEGSESVVAFLSEHN